MSLHPDYTGDYKYKWHNYPYMRLSGLEPLIVTPEINFVNVGESDFSMCNTDPLESDKTNSGVMITSEIIF